MALPLPPLPAPARSFSRTFSRTFSRRQGRGATAPARGEGRRAARARALVFFAGIASGLLVGLLACARPEDVTISPAKYDRDRAARAELVASIAADHETLAALIGSDRFAEPSAIYSDPELRTIAERLIERSHALGRLADTDVLAPGAP